MVDLNLAVKTRELSGKKVNKLRGQGQIPAVLYGHKVEPKSVVVNYHDFEKIYKQAGESTLVDLKIDGEKPVKVLIQDIQKDPISDQLLHVDFRQVRMDEKLRAEVELKFIGEPPAVKEFSGILVTNVDSVEVECLPKDLVHQIEVDLSSLKTFNDVIHISDMKVPAGITILEDAQEVIALVQQPRSEEELAELEKPVEEVIPAEAKEEAKPAEGQESEKEKPASAE